MPIKDLTEFEYIVIYWEGKKTVKALSKKKNKKCIFAL